jgi:hypothetical protein
MATWRARSRKSTQPIPRPVGTLPKYLLFLAKKGLTVGRKAITIEGFAVKAVKFLPSESGVSGSR